MDREQTFATIISPMVRALAETCQKHGFSMIVSVERGPDLLHTALHMAKDGTCNEALNAALWEILPAEYTKVVSIEEIPPGRDR